MKKLTKSFLILCLSIVLCVGNTHVMASELQTSYSTTITPRWSHLSDVTFSFAATSSGGHVDISYAGYPDSFSNVDVHVKLQKKFLLVFWTDVDEWSTSSTDDYGNFYHCFALNGTGTYKATLTFTVTGTDGTVDSYTDEIESKYSN